MARFQVDFFSQSLGMATSMDVIIPEPSAGQIGQSNMSGDETPVLYLLHGLSDDHSIWLRRTCVERYAAALGLAVIMPNAARSYYTDMAKGLKYWTFISEELPVLVDRFFRLSRRREKTFVAGLSMGGYGALKLGLNYPERFAAIGSFSGAVDPLALIDLFGRSDDPEQQARVTEFGWVFGDPPVLTGTGRDPFHLASTLAGEPGAVIPPIYLACGAQDFLIDHNRRFRSHLEALRLDFDYREESGTHEWGFWERHVKLFLDWLVKRDLL